MRKYTILKLPYKVHRVYGMWFLRLATTTGEYAVSVRVLRNTKHPDRIEFVVALRRLLIELKYSA